jgi:hypothetical protein
MSVMSENPTLQPATPCKAVCVSLYHVAIFGIGIIGVCKIMESTIAMSFSDDVLLSGLFGMIGATLTASRYVVIAVRHGRYEPRRILWQVLTPIQGGVLAIAGMIMVEGGIISLGGDSTNISKHVYFILSLSFLIGFSSEVFVKKLIATAETFFGEKGDGNVTTIESLENDK